MPLGTVCYNGCAQMNIIKNPGSEPIMTVAGVGNKRRVATEEQQETLWFSEFVCLDPMV